jgi:starch phosphorylase
MEYALSESLPIYSGGLGVLAGDFLRSAKALELPVVGVGILWAEGYAGQNIGADDRILDHSTTIDRTRLLREAPTVAVSIGGLTIPLQIYRVDSFMNAPLYLLEPIEQEHRWITNRLYSSGKDHRIAQEIVLGVGGVRAMEALGIDVDCYHFNEGHAVFAGLELLRRSRGNQADGSRGSARLQAALERIRSRVVFTTHTPIDAGNEEHDIRTLTRLLVGLGFSKTELVQLGGDPFNMTVAGLRMASKANGVSALHGVTAHRMWKNVSGVAPLLAITNGVDHRIWQDDRIRGSKTSIDLSNAHMSCKAELLDEIERREHVRLGSDRLLIGFARRATSYKRGTLLLSDPPRLERLLSDGRIQFAFAGKAHPKDEAGNDIIAALVAFARRYPRSFVFLPNYDLELGRLLTRGCDVWLNTPRRPLEACGTSGMKAAMNGVLNFSVLDGWWPEACAHGRNGWQLGAGAETLDTSTVDEMDAQSLYGVLEEEIVPTYYGEPDRWVAMMRQSIELTYRFSADRMVRDYFEKLYTASVPQTADLSA